MAIQFDAIHTGIGAHVLQNDIEPGAPLSVQHHIAARETDLRLAHLIEIDWQQLGRTGAVVLVSLAEARRQQANLQGIAAVHGAMPNHRATPFEQAAEQAPGL